MPTGVKQPFTVLEADGVNRMGRQLRLRAD